MIDVYKSAFAEPPWNEYKKCSFCGINYGIEEPVGLTCKRCNKELDLIEFWSPKEIKEDLDFALAQQDPIVLVAENSDEFVGMTWGYKIPFEKFPFLERKISTESSYMDEIAVRGDKRLKGIGTLLGIKYLENSKLKGMKEIVLRTDETNIASMALFRKLGFIDLGVRDPEFERRIYFAKELGEENE